MPLLSIKHHERTVGQIGLGSEGCFLRYSDDWLVKPDFWLSNRLPAGLAEMTERQASLEIKRFLENLLPEGRALDDLSLWRQLSKTNTLGLAGELGDDMSGALSFLMDDWQSVEMREIGFNEISERIGCRDHIPFSIWDRRFITTLAGFQDKIPVMRLGDGIFLSSETTHILKPESRDERLRHLVINEFFCMSLAKEAGFPVANVELLRTPAPALLVERFDRQLTGGSVRRIHIIDGCQALGLPTGHKYERNLGHGVDVKHVRDGASLSKLFGLIGEQDKDQLLRWVLFQYLIGNSDAHAKNISFFVGTDGLRLAPMYDAVSCEMFDGLSRDISMAIGDEFLFERVRAFDWAELGEGCGIDGVVIIKTMKDVAEAVEAALSKVSIELVDSGEVSHIECIKRLVVDRAHQLMDDAELVLEST